VYPKKDSEKGARKSAANKPTRELGLVWHVTAGRGRRNPAGRGGKKESGGEKQADSVQED